MNQLERDLHESLRRRKPPADLEAKVLAQTSAPSGRGIFSWRWLAVAASLALLIGGTMLIQENRRQAESERADKAKAELMVAFRITGSKVREIQVRLNSFQKRVVFPQLNP
jgi:hypothetical protein